MLHALCATTKLLRALAHTFQGWWTTRTKFKDLSEAERQQRVQQWAHRMLELMGISLSVLGTPPEKGPVLVVCNHLSWLDIVTIHAARHVRFVSKADIGRWPLIGTLSSGAGSLYIERERRRDAMRVVHRMTEALQGGDIIAIFPEGTTGDGNTLLPFHANLLQAAISAGAPVQPTAIRFADAATGETSYAPRYIGDDNLAVSLWNTLKAPPLLAIVRFGEPQASDGRDRRAWAEALHAEVQELRRQTH